MSLFLSQPGDDGLPDKERLFAMLGIMATTAMNVFDGSMINIALPKISISFGVSASEVVWVASSYLLAVSMTLVFFSALSTRIGFRRQFIGGLIVFTFSSVCCALSATLSELVVMRFIQGIGGAATLSIAPALLRMVFPSRLVGRVLGINALIIATCNAVAPLISGALLEMLNWRWIFIINIPLGVMAVFFSKRFLPKAAELNNRPLDKLGAFYSFIMLGSTILLINSFSEYAINYKEQQTIFYTVTALLSGVAFVYRQRGVIAPLLPLEIFSNQRFSLSAIKSLMAFIAQGITFIILPFLYESVYGYSPLTSAVLFITWPAGIVFVAPYAGKLADEKNPAVISTFGLVIFGIGLLLSVNLSQTSSVLDIVLRSLVCGIGFGLFQSPNNREMIINVEEKYSSYGSGVLAMMRTFGQCIGFGIFDIILSYSNSLNSSSWNTVHLGLQFASGAVFLAILVSVCRLKKL